MPSSSLEDGSSWSVWNTEPHPEGKHNCVVWKLCNGRWTDNSQACVVIDRFIKINIDIIIDLLHYYYYWRLHFDSDLSHCKLELVNLTAQNEKHTHYESRSQTLMPATMVNQPGGFAVSGAEHENKRWQVSAACWLGFLPPSLVILVRS